MSGVGIREVGSNSSMASGHTNKYLWFFNFAKLPQYYEENLICLTLSSPTREKAFTFRCGPRGGV